ncbi:hypothetical protein KQX54_009428 [Cotesia glomerata]|uniref:Uncharacterized protein n=1 Tax=Cotesia glomerata TaxID=32391 RepID=A0AAV7J4Y2_COTGL|nr:hypothetical protein KQX54_009428 [Cotesia glomerata]
MVLVGTLGAIMEEFDSDVMDTDSLENEATQLNGGPKKLDLCRTGLVKIPHSVLAFNAVEEILLGHNQLANPDNNLTLLKRFPSLQVVQLECNQLKSIPRELLQLEGLTSLDLSDNKIEQVPAEIHRLVK